MKFVRPAFLSLVGALLLGIFAPKAADAQVSIYGEFSATDLHNLVSTDILYGATTGLLYDGPTFHHVLIGGNLQGRFVNKSGGEKYDGIAVGPRFAIPLRHGFAPYGEFLIGFARYNNGAVNGSTTDSTIEINSGVSKRLSPRLDAVAEFSYAQYYALGGEYNPKTYSVGAIYHFSKR